jgi:hypothetical protein
MRTAFQIPTIDEVRIFMQAAKPEWHPKFVEYYSNRFWNSYQSKGWVISNNVKMKDFKAAFYNQWQKPRYQEDIDEFNKYAKHNVKPVEVINNNLAQTPDRTFEYLDELLNEYRRHPTLVSTERLASCYDFLKSQGMIRLNSVERQVCLEAYGKSQIKGKAIAVEYVFKGLINKLLTFSDLLKQRV